MDAADMELYGVALHNFWQNTNDDKLIATRDDGQSVEIPLDTFFQDESDFSPRERTALGLCHGRVLDVGAGAGRHSLVLQERGLSVCALDVCAQACDIMRQRGVKDVRHSDVFSLEDETFDTLLMLMHGICIVGD